MRQLGFEPRASRLSVECSSAELQAHIRCYSFTTVTQTCPHAAHVMVNSNPSFVSLTRPLPFIPLILRRLFLQLGQIHPLPKTLLPITLYGNFLFFIYTSNGCEEIRTLIILIKNQVHSLSATHPNRMLFQLSYRGEFLRPK